MNKNRCKWPGSDESLIHYHNTIWGVPEFNDKEIWKAIVLDTNQAGLSWKIIWHKYEGFRKAYANFDVKKVSKFTSRDVARLMKDAGIIRNKLKIQGTVKNAKAFLTVQKEFGTFSNYIWSFVNYKPIQTNLHHTAKMSSRNEISDAMSIDLKKRGFTFVGSTICYAFMQGIGMMNDHHMGCFRHKEVKRMIKDSLKKVKKHDTV